jgi:hypothetical protein
MTARALEALGAFEPVGLADRAVELHPLGQPATSAIGPRDTPGRTGAQPENDEKTHGEIENNCEGHHTFGGVDGLGTWKKTPPATVRTGICAATGGPGLMNPGGWHSPAATGRVHPPAHFDKRSPSRLRMERSEIMRRQGKWGCWKQSQQSDEGRKTRLAN